MQGGKGMTPGSDGGEGKGKKNTSISFSRRKGKKNGEGGREEGRLTL
nr:hypothetical protein [Tanacetum cinerariifolium]